jgi:hypothetical protein
MRVMHDGVPDADTRIASSFVFADGSKIPSGNNGQGAWLRCARDWLRRASGAVKLAV